MHALYRDFTAPGGGANLRVIVAGPEAEIENALGDIVPPLAVSLAGVAIIAARGDPGALLGLRLNPSDGIILLGYGDYRDYAQRLGQLAQQGTHFVRWGAAQAGQSEVVVGCDNISGGRMTTEHLIARGRRQPSFPRLCSVRGHRARPGRYRENQARC